MKPWLVFSCTLPCPLEGPQEEFLYQRSYIRSPCSKDTHFAKDPSNLAKQPRRPRYGAYSLSVPTRWHLPGGRIACAALAGASCLRNVPAHVRPVHFMQPQRPIMRNFSICKLYKNALVALSKEANSSLTVLAGSVAALSLYAKDSNSHHFSNA